MAKKISPCVYLILGRPGDRAGRVVDVDRLQPYVPRSDRLIPTEPNNGNLNDQLVDEHKSNFDSKQYSDKSVLLLVNPMAMENADDELLQNYLHAPVTTRPGRRAQRPSWLKNYEYF